MIKIRWTTFTALVAVLVAGIALGYVTAVKSIVSGKPENSTSLGVSNRASRTQTDNRGTMRLQQPVDVTAQGKLENYQDAGSGGHGVFVISLLMSVQGTYGMSGASRGAGREVANGTRDGTPDFLRHGSQPSPIQYFKKGSRLDVEIHKQAGVELKSGATYTAMLHVMPSQGEKLRAIAVSMRPVSR